jgi:hypothetical protein
VRADRDLRLAARQRVRERRAGATRVATGEQRHANAEGFEPRREVPRVLLGQELGGRHHRGLATVLDGAHGRERRHDGLAGAHVALHQPHHRVRTAEVRGDLAPHTALGGGKGEGQRRDEPLDPTAARRKWPGCIAIDRAPGGSPH